MATLEIHDPRGGVERVVVSRDQTTLIGSNSKCEIALNGEGVFPIHARLRWNPARGRFKVDASPDAQFLLVNGHRMASSSFRMGDEIEVAGYRIFLLNDGEAPGEIEAAALRDDPTRVQPPPFVPPPREPVPAAPVPAAPRERNSGGKRSKKSAPLAFADDFDAVVMELDAPVTGPAEASLGQPQSAPRSPDSGAKGRGFFGRWIDRLRMRGGAPGEEAVLSSPLVFALIGAFALLLVVGIALYGIIVRTAATRLYNQAVENLEDGDYRNAMRRFDEFLSSNPDDIRAGQARVHRAMAEVRQYTSGAGASWELALEAERAMFDQVGKEATFRDSSTELAEQILKTGENLADRARSAADPKLLGAAESTVELHARVAGPTAETFLKRSRLPAKLDAARAAVVKAGIRTRALAAMSQALQAGSASGVYAARDGLVAAYADLANDRELLSRMNAANDLIRKAVTVDPSTFPAETEPHEELLGPPTTLILRSPPEAPASPNATAVASVFAMADGMAYGVDGTTGEPVWQRPVGLSAAFPPQPVPGGTTVLAFDSRFDELVRLDAKSGALVWRQAVGESITDPPLVLGNQVIQPTPGGRLLFLKLETGELQGAMNLGLPLSGTPVSDEPGQILYVTARKDCVFILTRDPLSCVGVIYLGHAAGSVACSPARVGRYLVIPENHQFDAGRWRIFLAGESGQTLTPIQEVPVRGWTWATPASTGSVIWALGDRGGVAAWAIGGYTEKDPFRLIARINPTEMPTGPAFALARSEREVWVGSARSARVELDPEASKLTESWALPEAGAAVAPPQLVGNVLVLRQQNVEGPGVSLWGIDPQKGRVVWRTVLGAPWPSPPRRDRSGEALTTIASDGSTVRLDAEAPGAAGSFRRTCRA
ncbi:MAG: PQQ-binding-like beta-propeller repeat protein [Isosphaeraceae bacterium]